MVTLSVLSVIAVVLLVVGVILFSVPLILVLVLAAGVGLLVKALLLPFRLLNFLPAVLVFAAVLLLI